MDQYVIMLDDHVAGNLDNWPIVTDDETLEAARLRHQYQAVIKNLPRANYTANRIEDKSLMYTADGVTYKGAIYSLSACRFCSNPFTPHLQQGWPCSTHCPQCGCLVL